MAKARGALLQRAIQRSARTFWAKAAQNAASSDLTTLRMQRTAARRLREHLNMLIFRADARLALPRIGSNSFPRPFGTDWAWRPQLWRGPLDNPGKAAVENKAQLGDEITLFHDCAVSEITLRQLRNTREADLAPYGLRLDVFRFDGSYMSLVLDLPQDAVQGLSKRHLVTMNAIVEMEKPLEIFARLNIQHGPNTEQIVRELPLDGSDCKVEFDLAYSNINEKRIEKIWVDLIFEGPEMNQVVLRDVTLTRALRAEL